jgi:lipid-binding SYLF domain-containing protein
MKRYIVFLLLLCFMGLPAFASEERVLESANALQIIVREQAGAIPPELIRQARAIAVFPGVTRVGFFVGGLFGDGVMSVKDSQGWQSPLHVNLSGGSFGLQFGVERSDIVLFIMKYDIAQAIQDNKITLGADASVAAGPFGVNVSQITDFKLNRDIYAYTINKGLFAGVSLGGSVIGADKKTRTSPDTFAARSFVETLKQLENR